jgi:uncharacterized membrane protein
MAHGTESTPKPGEDWVVFASFDNARHGEHIFVKLGRAFRKDVRDGHAAAIVVTENADGSLKLRQSRAVTLTGYVGTLMHLSVSWLTGFMGVTSGLIHGRPLIGLRVRRWRSRHPTLADGVRAREVSLRPR